MWRGLVALVIFDLAGELLAHAGVPLPGPVLGLAALLVFLMTKDSAPRGLDGAADSVLRHLPLYFVPAAVGALYLAPRLATEAVPIAVALVVSTLVGLAVAGWLFQWLAKRGARPADAA